LLISFFSIVVLLAKGTERLTHELILITAEIYILHKANKVFSKYRRAKKNYICQEDIFTIEDTYDILAQKEVDKQIRCNKYSREIYRNERKSSARRYNTCKETGHNTRTCQEAIDISSSSDSSSFN
jgi:hypothetical protein